MAGRLIEIDQGDTYTIDGQNWAFPGDLFKTGTMTLGSAIVTIPFQLNFGVGPQTYSFQYDPFGRAVLLDSGGIPTTNFIAPLLSPTSPWRADDGVGGFIGFGPGKIDPQILGNGPPPGATYNPANALTAYRFVWNNVCAPVLGSCRGDQTDNVAFEAVLIDRGGGDFDLDFFYRNPQGPIPTDASGGFLLGATSRSITSFVSPGPDYCFRGGALSDTCSTVTLVPEPSSTLLFFLGLVILTLGAHGTKLRKQRV